MGTNMNSSHVIHCHLLPISRSLMLWYCARARAQAHTHTRKYTLTHSHTQAHTPTHTHTCFHAYTQTHKQTRAHTHVSEMSAAVSVGTHEHTKCVVQLLVCANTRVCWQPRPHAGQIRIRTLGYTRAHSPMLGELAPVYSSVFPI